MKFSIMYLKSIFKAMKDVSIILLIICVGVMSMRYVRSGAEGALFALLFFACLWLGLFVLLLLVMLKPIKRAMPHLKILMEKGFCDEYAEVYKRIEIDKKAPTSYNKLILASIYQTINRYDEAWAIYSQIDIAKLNSSDKALYYCDMMSYYLDNAHTSKARAIFDESKLYVDSRFLKSRERLTIKSQ